MFDPFEYTEDEQRVVREIYVSGNGGINDSDFAVQIMDSDASARNVEFSTFVKFLCGEKNLRQLLLSTKECGNENNDSFITRSKTDEKEHTITRNWLAASYKTGYEKRGFVKCTAEPYGGGFMLKFDAELGVSSVPIFILPKTKEKREARFTLDGKPFVGNEIASVDVFWQNKFLLTVDTADLTYRQAIGSAIFFVCDILCKLSICRIFRAIVVSYTFSVLNADNLEFKGRNDRVAVDFLTSNRMNEYLSLNKLEEAMKDLKAKLMPIVPLLFENLQTPYERLKENKEVPRASYTRAKGELDALNVSLDRLAKQAASLTDDPKTIVKSAQEITKDFREQVGRLISLQTTISADVLQAAYTQFRGVFDVAMMRMSDIVAKQMQKKAKAAFAVEPDKIDEIRNSYRLFDRLLSSQNSMQNVTMLYLVSNASSANPKNVFPNDNPRKLDEYLQSVSSDLFRKTKKDTSTLREASDFIYEALTEKTLNQKTLQGEQDPASLESRIFEYFKDTAFLTDVNLGIAALSKQAQAAVEILNKALGEYNVQEFEAINLSDLKNATRLGADGDGFFFDFQITSALDSLETWRMPVQKRVEKPLNGDDPGVLQKNVTLLSLAILVLNELRRFYREKKEIDFAQISIPSDVLSEVILQSSDAELALFTEKNNAAAKILEPVETSLTFAGERLSDNVKTLISLLQIPRNLRRIPNSESFVVETLEKLRARLASQIVTDLVDRFAGREDDQKVFDYEPLRAATVLLSAVVFIAKAQFVFLQAAEQRAVIIERVRATENIYTEYLARCIKRGKPYDWKNQRLSDAQKEIGDLKLREFDTFLNQVLTEQGKLAFKLPIPRGDLLPAQYPFETLSEINRVQSLYWETLYERNNLSEALLINVDPTFGEDNAGDIQSRIRELVLGPDVRERLNVDGIDLARSLMLISSFADVQPFTKAAALCLAEKLDVAFGAIPVDKDVSEAQKGEYFQKLRLIEEALIKNFNIRFKTAIAVPQRVQQTPASLLEKLADISLRIGGKDGDDTDDDADMEDEPKKPVEAKPVIEDTDIPADVEQELSEITKSSQFADRLGVLRVRHKGKPWLSQLEEISAAAQTFVAQVKLLLQLIVAHDKLLAGNQDDAKKKISTQLVVFQQATENVRSATSEEPFVRWAIRKSLINFHTDVINDALSRQATGVLGEQTKELIAKEKALGQERIEQQKAINAQLKLALADMAKIKGELKEQAAFVKAQAESVKKSVDVVEAALLKTTIDDDEIGKFQEKITKFQEKIGNYEEKVKQVLRNADTEKQNAEDARTTAETEFARKTTEFKDLITQFGVGQNTAKKQIGALVADLAAESDALLGIIGDKKNQELVRSAENSLKDGYKELKRLRNLNDKLRPLVEDVEEENTSALDLLERSRQDAVTDKEFEEAQQRAGILQGNIQTTVTRLRNARQQVQNVRLMAPNVDLQFASLLNTVETAFTEFITSAGNISTTYFVPPPPTSAQGKSARARTGSTLDD